jgi:NAD-dependent deacetylase
VLCTRCGKTSPMAKALERVEAGEDDPDCLSCGGVLKSATVMFGQALDPEVLGRAVGVAQACDVFIAVGTSLQVQPAASLAEIAVEHGARLVIVNAEPTPYDGLADEIVRDPIGEALPPLLAGLHQL